MRAAFPLAAAAVLGAGCAHVETAAPALAADAATLGAAGAEAATFAGRDAALRARRELTGPHLSPAGPMILPVEPALEPQAPNSLWRAGARSFFNDQRAARVGDILTVVIEISDRAEVSNSTSRSRSGSVSAGIEALAGQERLLGRLLPPGGSVPFDASALVDAEGRSESEGEGEISREERITLTVAAVVSHVLPNGNFLIAGRQEVRINAEVRDLTVSGLIRPQDISSDNTIRHTQIAEARISYGGRGVISTMQRPRWGQRLVDAVSPF